MASLYQNRIKRSQSCISCTAGDREIEINISWNFEARSMFLKSLFQNIAVLTSMVTSLIQKLNQKGPRLVFRVPVVIIRWKSIVKENLRLSIRFWNHYLKILKFWLPLVTSPTRKWVKKVEIGISCTCVDKKMKIKSKRYFEMY